jgi:hypothetical protein
MTPHDEFAFAFSGGPSQERVKVRINSLGCGKINIRALSFITAVRIPCFLDN